MTTGDGLIFVLLGLAMGLALLLFWSYGRERRKATTRVQSAGASAWEESRPTPAPSPSGTSDDENASVIATTASAHAPQRPQPEKMRTREAVGTPAATPLARRAGGHRGSLWVSRALPPELERARLKRELEELLERRRRFRRRAALVGAGALAGLTVALLIPPVRSALKPYAAWIGIRLGLLPPPPPPEPAPPPRDLEVSYSNQVEEKGGRLTFRGTVRNISDSKTFEDVYAELSLIKRESRLIETRVVPVRPSRLGPGQIGTYEVTVPASEFMGNRRVRILAGGAEVPYRYVLPEASPSK
jgi:hypothetical protein